MEAKQPKMSKIPKEPKQKKIKIVAVDEDKNIEKMRIAIVDKSKCSPKICKQECKKVCSINKAGRLCIEVAPTDKISKISEYLCIGCGLCVKKCPFEAIKILNIPEYLSKFTTHRYGPNSFKLHRLPIPRSGQIIGVVGANGTGKTTALHIISGKLKPNLGNFDEPPEWTDILNYFKGSELQKFFTCVLENNLKSAIKPQFIDTIPKFVKGNLQKIIDTKDQKKNSATLLKALDLGHLLARDIEQLSGGELQRVAIMIVAMQNVNLYIFDEPTSYLDIKQRLKASQVIRSLLQTENYIVVVEHDLIILDYLSDFICCSYGEPSVYGVFSMPYSVGKGINIFLAGYIPAENLRFREEEISFKVKNRFIQMNIMY